MKLSKLNEVNKIKDDFNSYKPFNDELAGNISKEFEITKDTWSYIEKLVSPLIGIYEKEFDYAKSIRVMSEDKELYLASCWVNFQQKHVQEFRIAISPHGILPFSF